MMAGHRKFSELRAGMAPEGRARNAADTARLLAEMPLVGDPGDQDGNAG